ncbi:MAG: hypothetical protein ACP5MX_01855 [Candidatus Micrarchaeia archaeon]
MGLTARVFVAAVVIALLVGIIFLFKSAPQPQQTEQEAISIVMKEVNNTFPGAKVGIVNVSNTTIGSGPSAKVSWTIVLSIVRNATRPCPILSIESYSYPETVLLPTAINNYTQYSNGYCTINNESNLPGYVIASPYIAQARSFDLNLASLKSFISKVGYANTIVSASYMQKINVPISGSQKNFTNAWLIRYSSPLSSNSLYIIMNDTGALLYNYSSNS